MSPKIFGDKHELILVPAVNLSSHPKINGDEGDEGDEGNQGNEGEGERDRDDSNEDDPSIENLYNYDRIASAENPSELQTPKSMKSSSRRKHKTGKSTQ